jgi:hypothetical protein
VGVNVSECMSVVNLNATIIALDAVTADQWGIACGRFEVAKIIGIDRDGDVDVDVDLNVDADADATIGSVVDGAAGIVRGRRSVEVAEIVVVVHDGGHLRR